MAKENEHELDFIPGKIEKIKGKLKFDLHTAVAWMVWAVLLTYAYMNPNPQFPSYAIWLTAGTLGYSGKRLLQKRKEYNNVNGN